MKTSIILGIGKGKGPMMEGMEDEEAFDACDAAGDEFVAALKAKDSQAIKDALKAFVEACLAEEPSEPDWED